ncbi:MAG: serine/threonine protein kinase, partial [Steroidobacteraceae bacterium]
MTAETPYASLGPDLVLDAVAACGMWPDGRLLALNSYENRVWQVGLDDEPPVIAKFYRPGRWSDAAIIEEYTFAQELAAAELPVVAPLVVGGRTLLFHDGFRYALTPRRGGRAPELEAVDQLQWLGRLIARMHVVGARAPFAHRGRLDRETMVQQPMQAVLDSSLLPASLQTNYRAAATRLDAAIASRLAVVGPQRQLRLHGDCHPGNVLWTDDGPHFVD